MYIYSKSCHSLNPYSIFEYDRTTYEAGSRFFSGWDNVLKAIGLNPAEHRIQSPVRSYTKLQVLSEIKKRLKQDKPLNISSVSSENGSLAGAGRRRFGSWLNALTEAGLAPDEHMLRSANNKYPTKASVIKMLKARKKRGEPLNHASIVKGEYIDKALYNCAMRVFGDWNTALAAAGIKKQDATTYRKYSNPQDIIKTIRKRHRARMPLNSMTLSRGTDGERDASLLNWGTKLFGSWNKALAAAGLDTNKISKWHKVPRKIPTKLAVIRAIRKRHKDGLVLSSHAIVNGLKPFRDSVLVSCGREYFGSWPAALGAAAVKTKRN